MFLQSCREDGPRATSSMLQRDIASLNQDLIFLKDIVFICSSKIIQVFEKTTLLIVSPHGNLQFSASLV